MRYGKLRKRISPLSAAAVLALSTVGLVGGSGTASAAPLIPHTICYGPYAQVNYRPGLDLIPQYQEFNGFSHSTGCLGAFNGGLVMQFIVGDGPLLSCLASSGTDGDILFRWSDNQFSRADIIELPVNNVSKGIFLKFVVHEGKFAGNNGTLLVESLGNTVLCLVPDGLRRIEGPIQFEFGL